MSQNSHSFEEFSVQATGSIRIGIVASCNNRVLVDGLLDRVVGHLKGLGAEEGNIEIHRVPGMYDIPYVVHRMAMFQEHDVLVALGVSVDDVMHSQQHAVEKAAGALLETMLELEVPIVHGIVLADSVKQGEAYSTGSMDRGRELAETALVMANYKRRFDACEEGPTMGFTH